MHSEALIYVHFRLTMQSYDSETYSTITPWLESSFKMAIIEYLPRGTA